MSASPAAPSRPQPAPSTPSTPRRPSAKRHPLLHPAAKVVLFLLCLLPLGWYLMGGWLNDFADRTEMSWWIFAAAFVSTVIIATLTLSFHAIRTAVANPVTSLRTE